jgi:regulator of protease activity HflC (stomatin/prohibitin superfamily)
MEWVIALIAVAVVALFVKTVVVVPHMEAWVIERLGRYHKTKESGLHFIWPVVDRIAHKHSLKEQAVDVRPQLCITQDNVQVQVDGILYYKITDPYKASYGIENHNYATAQLAQTTMRSEIGKIVLDKTFSEREEINNQVVKSVDVASDPWGIKVTRYEIKDIEPPPTVVDAMEMQMEAERKKRAEILDSEGVREARINNSKGEKEEAINISRGEKQKRINEAEGKARSIEILAEASAQGIEMIGKAIQQPRGKNALSLQIAEQYVSQLGEILENSEVEVMPMEVAQIHSLIQSILPNYQGLPGGKK